MKFLIKVATLSLCAASAALAAPTTSAWGNCSEGVGGLLDDIPGTVSCAGGVWVDPRPGTLSQASWSATAAYGELHAQASTVVNTTPEPGSNVPLALGVGAQSHASFTDELIFTAPGVQAGQAGRLNFNLQVDGAIALEKFTAHTAARGDWLLSVGSRSGGRTLGSAGDSGSVTQFYDQPLTGDPQVSRTVGFSLPIIFGQMTTLNVALDLSVFASGWRGGAVGSVEYLMPVTSSADANFAHTIKWGGITSVTLAQGGAVSDWALTSGSGTDYALAVPETSSAWMLMAGLGCLAAARKWSARCKPARLTH